MKKGRSHYNDVVMMVSQITSVSIVCSNVCSGADQRKHQSSASLVFVWGIPVDSPHRPVKRKMRPFDDVIIYFNDTARSYFDCANSYKTHLELKSREITFTHHFLGSPGIVLKFCREYDSDLAKL